MQKTKFDLAMLPARSRRTDGRTKALGVADGERTKRYFKGREAGNSARAEWMRSTMDFMRSDNAAWRRVRLVAARGNGLQREKTRLGDCCHQMQRSSLSRCETLRGEGNGGR